MENSIHCTTESPWFVVPLYENNCIMLCIFTLKHLYQLLLWMKNKYAYFISVVSAFIISEIYIRTNVNFFLIGHQVLVLIANSSSHYTLTIYVHMHILVKLFCMHYLQWQLAQLEQWQQKMPHTNTSDMMVNKPTTVRPVIFQNFVILFYAHTPKPKIGTMAELLSYSKIMNLQYPKYILYNDNSKNEDLVVKQNTSI